MTVLDDLLRRGLRLVICGTAASSRSAELRSYYAGPGNKFWRTMHEIGLTPERLHPTDWRLVDGFDIGFTDLAKFHSGMDTQLPLNAFDPERLREAITTYQPKILAFNGKKAGQTFLGRKQLAYGLQPDTLGATAIWVLPSTSGAASGAWSRLPWEQLAAAVSAQSPHALGKR